MPSVLTIFSSEFTFHAVLNIVLHIVSAGLLNLIKVKIKLKVLTPVWWLIGRRVFGYDLLSISLAKVLRFQWSATLLCIIYFETSGPKPLMLPVA